MKRFIAFVLRRMGDWSYDLADRVYYERGRYLDSGERDELEELINQISPTDTPYFSKEWQTDRLDTKFGD